MPTAVPSPPGHAPGLWLRREIAADERRAVIAPREAAHLIALGVPVTVEVAEQRAFTVQEYAAAGCRIVPADTWPDAPELDVVVGLKTPSTVVHGLRHRHVFFGHAYKGQRDGEALLDRFVVGGGTLFDLESLVDDAGRRLCAFGFWAGYVGAALAVLRHRGLLGEPLQPWTREGLDDELRRSALTDPDEIGALVIGARGRSGRGACAALAVAGVTAQEWDVDETAVLDRAAVAGADLLVNAVATDAPGEPFVDADLAAGPRRLRTVSDVTCDVTSARNRVPVNGAATTWPHPARQVHAGPPPLEILAIDNLPSLLPRESSAAFSSSLVDLLGYVHEGSPVWRRCELDFVSAVSESSERSLS